LLKGRAIGRTAIGLSQNQVNRGLPPGRIFARMPCRPDALSVANQVVRFW
jgi:hypothetical protein